jgi:hypothetical protein
MGGAKLRASNKEAPGGWTTRNSATRHKQAGYRSLVQQSQANRGLVVSLDTGRNVCTVDTPSAPPQVPYGEPTALHLKQVAPGANASSFSILLL